MSNKLTSAQQGVIVDWVKNKRKVVPCPSCGQPNFNIADHLVAPPIFDSAGNFTIGGPAYPHFMLTCTNCGLTQFYNAVQAGVVK